MKHLHIYENFHRPSNQEGWAIIIAFSAGMGSVAARIFPAAEVDRAYYDLLAQRVGLGYKLERIGPGQEEVQMTKAWKQEHTYAMIEFVENDYAIAGGTLEDAQEQAEDIYLPGKRIDNKSNATDPQYDYAFPVSVEHWTVINHRGEIFFDPTPERAFDFTDDPGLLAAANTEVNPRWA